jgi:hypothetical protein
MNIVCSLTRGSSGIFGVARSRQAWKIDIPHEGGALVSDNVAKKPEYDTVANGKARNSNRVRGEVRRQKPRSAIKRCRETFHHPCKYAR